MFARVAWGHAFSGCDNAKPREALVVLGAPPFGFPERNPSRTNQQDIGAVGTVKVARVRDYFLGERLFVKDVGTTNRWTFSFTLLVHV